MAYSDYGASVWMNEQLLKNNCEVTPSNVLKGVRGSQSIWLHLGATRGQDLSRLDDLAHGVMGDKDSGLMIVLYKQGVRAVYDLTGEAPQEMQAPPSWHMHEGYSGENLTLSNGSVIAVVKDDIDLGISFEFTDALGRVWTAETGYQIGGGFDWEIENEN